VDGPVPELLGERVVHAPMLLQQGSALEGRARDDDLEVIAPAGAILNCQLECIRKRCGKSCADRVGVHGVCKMLSVTPRANRLRRVVPYALSVPERLVRSLAAAFGGTVHETANLVLPRFVRGSRLYEATAKNVLRVTVELVGGVEGRPAAQGDLDAPPAAEIAKRKLAGNVVELGSIAAFGFSPLWLLAAASDVLHGSRVYLDALVGELRREGVLAGDVDISSVDDLLGALEGASGTTARLIDIPPLELEALRRTLGDLRSDAASLPAPEELHAVYVALAAESKREQRSLLEVSVGMGLAFFNSARKVGRQHVLDPYTEDLKPLRDEGFGAYARRVGRPYAAAVSRSFDPGAATLTERGIARVPGTRGRA
jgi:hypothetical protein